MEKKTRVYIAGKISGTDDFTERFRKTEEEFIKIGCEVLNPAKLPSIMPESTTHDEYLTLCYCMIEMSDIVYFLKDWKKSVGATMEYKYCVRHGKRCIFEKENSEIDLFGQDKQLYK